MQEMTGRKGPGQSCNQITVWTLWLEGICELVFLASAIATKQKANHKEKHKLENACQLMEKWKGVHVTKKISLHSELVITDKEIRLTCVLIS